jgi:hypothetical protein
MSVMLITNNNALQLCSLISNTSLAGQPLLPSNTIKCPIKEKPSHYGHNSVNSNVLIVLFTQGIGDSSQGFANFIIFVIFTKNIRDSFIKCIRCRRRRSNDETLEAEGQIQAYSEQSYLNPVSSDAKLLVGDSHEVDEGIFGKSESIIEKSQQQPGSFKKYGAVS